MENLMQSQLVSGTFRRMEIVEEEIARAKLDRATGHRAFGILVPPVSLRNKDDRLYRAHARELIERTASGESAVLATKAEVLAALSELSLTAPPNQQHAALMETLFAEVMGKKIDGEPIREPFEGASGELFEQLRRRFRTDGREPRAET